MSTQVIHSGTYQYSSIWWSIFSQMGSKLMSMFMYSAGSHCCALGCVAPTSPNQIQLLNLNLDFTESSHSLFSVHLITLWPRLLLFTDSSVSASRRPGAGGFGCRKDCHHRPFSWECGGELSGRFLQKRVPGRHECVTGHNDLLAEQFCVHCGQ